MSGLPRDQFLSNPNTFYNSEPGFSPYIPTAPPFTSVNHIYGDIITSQPYRSNSQRLFGVHKDEKLTAPPIYESLYDERT